MKMYNGNPVNKILGDNSLNRQGYRHEGGIPQLIESVLLTNGPTRSKDIINQVNLLLYQQNGKKVNTQNITFALWDMTEGYYSSKYGRQAPIIKINRGLYDLSPERRKQLRG